MLTEKAVVKAIQDNAVLLEPRQETVCNDCSMNKGCGHRLFDSLFGDRDKAVTAQLASGIDPATLSPGQSVVLAMEEGRLLIGTGVLYGLPLAGLIAGAVFTSAFTVLEGIILVGAVSGLTGGLVIARRLAKWLERDALRIISADTVDSRPDLIARSSAS